MYKSRLYTSKLIQAGSYYGFSMAAADFRGRGYDLSNCDNVLLLRSITKSMICSTI